MTAVLLLVALLAGLVFRHLGYPPLVGFLLAGFIAHEAGVGEIETIRQLAEIGITLLLFTIGLKLNLRELAQVQVWGTASAHMTIAVVLTVPVIVLAGLFYTPLALGSYSAAWVLAFALSFSSTVFAVKIFEQRGGRSLLYADIAIGILIVQDIFAVCFLVFTSDELPSLWALGLLVLPLLKPLFTRILDRVGYGELLVLFGVAAAFGAHELFELVHLKGDLGALLIGVFLGNSKKSKELYNSLVSVKDLFLIGFFLQIGFYGLPSAEMLLVALALSLLIFIRPFLYFILLTGFGLRARTAFLCGFSLFNYSEFGLIVGAIAVSSGMLSSEWLTTLALAMAVSLFIATVFNTRVYELYNKNSDFLQKFERHQRLERDKFSPLGDADCVILGMGRVGLGAYRRLKKQFGDSVVGVEQNLDRVNKLTQNGYRCIHADASDYDFWLDSKLAERRLLFVNLSSHQENLNVVSLAKQFNYKGALAVISRYPDHTTELVDKGCIAFNLYAEAGRGFAECVLRRMKKKQVP